jgi:hypothetical protein
MSITASSSRPTGDGDARTSDDCRRLLPWLAALLSLPLIALAFAFGKQDTSSSTAASTLWSALLAGHDDQHYTPSLATAAAVCGLLVVVVAGGLGLVSRSRKQQPQPAVKVRPSPPPLSPTNPLAVCLHEEPLGASASLEPPSARRGRSVGTQGRGGNPFPMQRRNEVETRSSSCRLLSGSDSSPQPPTAGRFGCRPFSPSGSS